MNCQEVEQQDILGAYIAGKLPEAQRDLFEEHFFGCDDCLRNVEAARVAREVLIARKASAPARNRWIPWLAAAALLVVGIAIWKAKTGRQIEVAAVAPKPAAEVAEAKAGPDYTLLAKFDPPVYRPANLRGAEKTDRAFRAAMERYAAGDFAGAAVGLRAVAGATAAFVEARYYLGIAELQTGDIAPGLSDLQRVIAAGDTPFLSEARFYAAKASLGQNDAAAARLQLETLVREKSELAPRAEEILKQLPQAPPKAMNPAQ